MKSSKEEKLDADDIKLCMVIYLFIAQFMFVVFCITYDITEYVLSLFN